MHQPSSENLPLIRLKNPKIYPTADQLTHNYGKAEYPRCPSRPLCPAPTIVPELISTIESCPPSPNFFSLIMFYDYKPLFGPFWAGLLVFAS